VITITSRDHHQYNNNSNCITIITAKNDLGYTTTLTDITKRANQLKAHNTIQLHGSSKSVRNLYPNRSPFCAARAVMHEQTTFSVPQMLNKMRIFLLFAAFSFTTETVQSLRESSSLKFESLSNEKDFQTL